MVKEPRRLAWNEGKAEKQRYPDIANNLRREEEIFNRRTLL